MAEVSKSAGMRPGKLAAIWAGELTGRRPGKPLGRCTRISWSSPSRLSTTRISTAARPSSARPSSAAAVAAFWRSTRTAADLAERSGFGGGASGGGGGGGDLASISPCEMRPASCDSRCRVLSLGAITNALSVTDLRASDAMERSTSKTRLLTSQPSSTTLSFAATVATKTSACALYSSGESSSHAAAVVVARSASDASAKASRSAVTIAFSACETFCRAAATSSIAVTIAAADSAADSAASAASAASSAVVSSSAE